MRRSTLMEKNVANDITDSSKKVGTEPVEMKRRARGFAAMDQSKQRQIASQGGKAAHEQGTAHRFSSEEAQNAGRKGGEAVSSNRSHMAEIGRKGGEARQKNARLRREEEARLGGKPAIDIDDAQIGSETMRKTDDIQNPGWSTKARPQGDVPRADTDVENQRGVNREQERQGKRRDGDVVRRTVE